MQVRRRQVCLGVKSEININRAYMAHVVIVEQQRGNSAAYDGELAPETAKNLADFNEN